MTNNIKKQNNEILQMNLQAGVYQFVVSDIPNYLYVFRITISSTEKVAILTGSHIYVEYYRLDYFRHESVLELSVDYIQSWSSIMFKRQTLEKNDWYDNTATSTQFLSVQGIHELVLESNTWRLILPLDKYNNSLLIPSNHRLPSFERTINSQLPCTIQAQYIDYSFLVYTPIIEKFGWKVEEESICPLVKYRTFMNTERLKIQLLMKFQFLCLAKLFKSSYTDFIGDSCITIMNIVAKQTCESIFNNDTRHSIIKRIIREQSDIRESSEYYGIRKVLHKREDDIEEDTCDDIEEMKRHNVKYKSKICKHWATDNSCNYGKNCIFAHGIHDLKDNDTHKLCNNPLYKKTFCAKWRHGVCPFGIKCFFAHGQYDKL